MIEAHPPISLAIPTWNRFEMVQRAVAQVLNDSRINEICITDDASSDGSYEKLKDWAAGQQKFIKVIQNSKNLDCYCNKAQVLRDTLGEWAILFDSDNVLPVSYLDALWALPHWDPMTSYLPVFARPHFDYRAFAGKLINRHNVAGFMNDPTFRCALNTANCFVHRLTYLKVWDPSVDPHTVDSMFMNYRLLEAGYRLQFVPGLEYDHEVHAQSHYKLNFQKTGSFAGVVETKLRALR